MLVFDEDDECDGFEGEVGDVADAEGQDEGASLGDVGEGPGAEEDEVEEEGADGEPEEVFDEGTGVFVETFHYGVVLQAGDEGEIERYEGEDGLEDALCEPEGAEGGQDHDDGHEGEGDVVFSHGAGVFVRVVVGVGRGGISG